MANELRSRTMFLSGLVDDDPLTAAATTLTATELASLPAITSAEHAVIVLDPNGDSGAPEIVHVTLHTGSATTATIVRASEGTTARQHEVGTRWYHGPTLRDLPRFAFARRVSGDITANGTSWANLDTGLDLALGVAWAGDIVEVGLAGTWQNESVEAGIDAVSLVSASPVNAWAQDGAEGGSNFGLGAWKGISGVDVAIGGSVYRELVSGDLDGGNLTLRFRVRTGTASNKVLNATAADPLQVYAINHGPAAL